MEARNKTELAARLGYTRTTLYTFMRVKGFPKPDRRGHWNIEACRKFILKQAQRLHGPDERDRLQAQLLSLKVEKAAKELADFEADIRNQIHADTQASVMRTASMFGDDLIRMVDDLGRHFNNREICRVGKSLLRKVLTQTQQRVREALGGKEGDEPSASN